VEQAHVLDGDYGLVGKTLDQLNVLLREGAGGQLVKSQHANCTALAEHGCREYGPESYKFLCCCIGEFSILKHVGHLDCATQKRGSPNHRMKARSIGMQRNLIAPLGFNPVSCCEWICLSYAATEDAHIRSTQSCRCFDQGIEDLLQIESRAADDLEH